MDPASEDQPAHFLCVIGALRAHDLGEEAADPRLAVPFEAFDLVGQRVCFVPVEEDQESVEQVGLAGQAVLAGEELAEGRVQRVRPRLPFAAGQGLGSVGQFVEADGLGKVCLEQAHERVDRRLVAGCGRSHVAACLGGSLSLHFSPALLPASRLWSSRSSRPALRLSISSHSAPVMSCFGFADSSA